MVDVIKRTINLSLKEAVLLRPSQNVKLMFDIMEQRKKVISEDYLIMGYYYLVKQSVSVAGNDESNATKEIVLCVKCVHRENLHKNNPQKEYFNYPLYIGEYRITMTDEAINKYRADVQNKIRRGIGVSASIKRLASITKLRQQEIFNK